MGYNKQRKNKKRRPKPNREVLRAILDAVQAGYFKNGDTFRVNRELAISSPDQGQTFSVFQRKLFREDMSAEPVATGKTAKQVARMAAA